MRTGSIKAKWLLNFSSSPVGGGLKRLIETAKWFDEQNGAVFLVNFRALNCVSKYSRHNRFVSIKQGNVRRFVADGKYLHPIVDEIGVPDFYFSYGIPVFYRTGRINWFHFSNALTLTTDASNTPFIRRFEHKVLGRRIVRSMRNVQIASAESDFSLALLG